MTVRAPAPTLAALNRTFADLLDGKSEVLLDVKIYEVENTRTSLIGVQLPQTTNVFNVPSELNSVIASNSSLVQQIIQSGLASAGDLRRHRRHSDRFGRGEQLDFEHPLCHLRQRPYFDWPLGRRHYGKPELQFGRYAFPRSGPDPARRQRGRNYPQRHALSHHHLELLQHSATAVNIPGITTAGLSGILGGLGINASALSTAAPIPQVQYQDLGLIFKVTPRIERNDDVTLKLDLKIQALQGGSLNGLPVLTNRSYTADIHLVNGASALVVGNLSRQESNAVSGNPGLSELPGFTRPQRDHQGIRRSQHGHPGDAAHPAPPA